MAYWVLGCLFSCVIMFRSGRSEDCFNNVVGLRETNGIPSYYFQASSFSQESFDKRNELNKGETAWCTYSGEEKDSYLEVDLGSEYFLCGVSTQGDVMGNVTKYKLLMSSNRIKWTAYSENNTIKVFSGNKDTSDIVKHNFTSTQKARFVRFYPIEYVNAACMLIELFGTKIPKEICEKSSLFENNKAFTITTSNRVQLGNIQQSWCLPSNSSNPYLQIDIGSYSVVCAVKVLDNTSSVNVEQKSYHLEVSMDGKDWSAFRERNLVKKYVTNEDHILYNRILCRYIRFTALRNVKCLRVELFGYSYEDLLTVDIGLKYDSRTLKKKFPDQAFTSTSMSSVRYREPKYGRLYQPDSSWCSKEKPKSYLEIVLVEQYYIFAVSVQGFYLSRSFLILTKKLRLLYSTDYENWYNSNDNGAEWMIINRSNGVSKYILRTPIEARIVRLEMPYRNVFSCLKVELHGISAINAGCCPNQYPLGLSAGLIADSNIKVSTYYYFSGSEARLRNNAAWIPSKTDKNPHITIDLGELVLVSGVATQGINDGGLHGRMTYYRIRYSYDDQQWYNYTHHNNSDKIFNGNIPADNVAIFANWLDPPIVARFIRLIAVARSGRLCVRMELYGCREAFEAPAINVKSSKPTLNRVVNAVVNLTCIVDGQPQITITWTRNGLEIHNSSFEVYNTVYPLHTGVSGTAISNLTITYNHDQDIYDHFNCTKNKTNPRELHCRSIYECSASYPGGNAAKRTVTINVAPNIIKPRILTSLNDADVENGTSYQLNCSVYGDPNVTYTWSKDGNQSIPNSQVINKNKTLRIDPVTIENEGLYTCIAKNIDNNVSTTAKITVFAPPEISNPPKSQTLNETQTATFYCIGKGIPTPEVIWRKNGEVIRNYTRYNITTTWSMEDRESTLIIQNAEYDDRGNYSCTMKNRKDFQNKTAVLTVQVRPSASVVKPVYRVKLSRSVNLTCVVYGFPRPNVLWRKSGEKINRSTKYRIVWNKTESELTWHSILEINTLRRNDNGGFICFLENVAGTDETSLSLVVLERPDRLNFSSRNLTSRTIILQWKVTFDGNSDIKYFVLHYSSNATDGVLQKEMFPPNETMFMLKILKPWRWYTFQMTAINYIGSSNVSFITSRTFEDLPSSPENVSVVTLSATALGVTWSPPKEENGIITKYVIYYGEKGQTNIINASASSLRRDIGGFKPYTNYTIQVEAYTSIGSGDRSISVIGLTNESIPSEPLNVRSTVATSISLSIFWDPPKHRNGKLTHYVVYYQITNMPRTLRNLTSDFTRASLSPLRHFTNYTLEVKAFTSAGPGSGSKAITRKTFEGVPSKPRYVSQTSSTNSSVNITWDAPEHLNGILTRYTIRYKKEDGDYKQDRPMKKTSWTIEDLEPYTKYNVYVQAHTSVGAGDWSERSQAATQPGENSGIPEDPETMIVITLSPLTSKKRNIIFYRIIVVFIKDKDPLKDPQTFKKLSSYDEIKAMDPDERYQKAYVAFAFEKTKFDKYQIFTLGNGEDFSNTFSDRRKRDSNEYKNGPLISGSQYAYHLRGYTNETYFVYSEAFSVSTSNPTEKGKHELQKGDLVTIVIVVAVLFIMVLVVTSIWFRVKKKKSGNPSVQGLTNNGHTIPLSEFGSNVESTDEFSDEFQEIPNVMACAITGTSRSTDTQKNRYRDIVPCDYTRVFLSEKEGEENSDFINASFIKGFRKPEKYIAIQGPLPQTTNDFWRMVWEQECSVIVMLTALEEDGKVKCYQYWPATPEGKIYDNIAIHQSSQMVLADYTVRYFTLKDVSTEEIRKVEHLHFTAWPDHGVPRHPGPLLAFHNRFRSALVGPLPAIVHCSTGCGRTGTFIALDYTLQKLSIERDSDPMIDILRNVREMHGERCHMVQTQEQYEFIHHAVVEAVTVAHPTISSADVRVKAAILRERKTKYKGEFEKLQQRIAVEPCEVGSSPENEMKNRSQAVPYDYNRVYLGEMPNKTDYINASLVFGYQFSGNFIATQNPLPNTVEDFWRMIYEQKCGVIVCISTNEEQDEFGFYWPSEGIASYGPITVTFGKVNNDFAASGFVVRNFSLTDTRDNPGNQLSVNHFHYSQWPRDGLPQASSLLRLLAEVERVQRFSGNMLVTVHCSDGCGRTGTLCAIITAIERVKLENSLDLLVTVRNLRAQRPEMVQNEIHYQFCYDAIVAFLASFGNGDFPSTSAERGNHMVTKC